MSKRKQAKKLVNDLQRLTGWKEHKGDDRTVFLEDVRPRLTFELSFHTKKASPEKLVKALKGLSRKLQEDRITIEKASRKQKRLSLSDASQKLGESHHFTSGGSEDAYGFYHAVFAGEYVDLVIRTSDREGRNALRSVRILRDAMFEAEQDVLLIWRLAKHLLRSR